MRPGPRIWLLSIIFAFTYASGYMSFTDSQDCFVDRDVDVGFSLYLDYEVHKYHFLISNRKSLVVMVVSS